MKIVSVVVFACALIGTWWMVHAAPQVSETMHVGIQNDLKKIITEYVQKNLPTSKNLHFDRFWTETVKKDQVMATFAYSFTDPSGTNGDTLVEISGRALLTKGDETPQAVTWNLTSLQINDSHVDFQEPIQITAGKTSPAAEKEE